ncbi:hypothetical protein B4168_1490 [Anoxybacillus flavithermus]|nr:hypothetical protein B4168_1490 [Anoxybacillus flavithermus]OAO84146.1 hypothetical protein GT23_3681 [Parageobacillus thermoglucosidasius]
MRKKGVAVYERTRNICRCPKNIKATSLALKHPKGIAKH